MPGMIQPRRALRRISDFALEVTIRSPASGNVHSKILPISPKQWNDWQQGEYIQNALGHLSAEDREWLMSGLTAEEFDTLYSDED